MVRNSNRAIGQFYMAPSQEGDGSIHEQRQGCCGCTEWIISNETDEAGRGQIMWATQANGRHLY